MLELFDFQKKAALKIVEKYKNHLHQQIINTLTGSEKIVISQKFGETSKLGKVDRKLLN